MPKQVEPTTLEKLVDQVCDLWREEHVGDFACTERGMEKDHGPGKCYWGAFASEGAGGPGCGLAVGFVSKEDALQVTRWVGYIDYPPTLPKGEARSFQLPLDIPAVVAFIGIWPKSKNLTNARIQKRVQEVLGDSWSDKQVECARTQMRWDHPDSERDFESWLQNVKKSKDADLTD